MRTTLCVGLKKKQHTRADTFSVFYADGGRDFKMNTQRRKKVRLTGDGDGDEMKTAFLTLNTAYIFLT